jgi:outer membrane protein
MAGLLRALYAVLACAVLLSGNARAQADPSGQDALPSRIQGDIGVLTDEEQSPIKGEATAPQVFPFAFFDYGRFYARIDTFGVKTVHMGYGYLELAGRAAFNGFKSAGNPALAGIQDRQNAAPLGLGTFQITPIGGFFVYALHDFNRSRGNLLELTYIAELDAGRVTVYPEIGFEHFSRQYTRYYAGVSAAEAAASGYAPYEPGAVTNPFLCLFVQVQLAQGWDANFYLRRKWLGAAMGDSPLVDTSRPLTGFAAITAHFE